LGDFVKGSQLEHLPSDIQQGIQLHRKIDSFTDSHPRIVSLRELTPAHLRRMSGVIFDIYFDHLLCRSWSNYTNHSQHSVLEQFYCELSSRKVKVAGRYPLVRERLIEYQWLQDYAKEEACYRAYHHIEKRLRNKIIFAEQAKHFVLQNHQRLDDTFNQFYPELIAYTQHMSESSNFDE